MNILIDTTEIRLHRLNSSIPIYIRRFISHINNNEQTNYILLINEECKEYFTENFPGFKTVTFKFKGWNRYWHLNPKYLYNQYKFRRFLKELEISTIFIPTDYPRYLQDKLPCKKVIVIHDLKGIKRNCHSINEAYEAYITNKMYARLLNTSDKIIAISKYTKQDIQVYYPEIDESKIAVIYNSVVLTNTSKCPNKFNLNKYILYVNSLLKHKNISTLIKALSKLSYEIDHNLVIVGKKTNYWEETIVPILKQNKIEDRIIHLQNITDEELRFLYENATVFVTPSLNEGFGYTPIEAAIYKCPVISSIQEALPDSTQGLLHYYQPAMDSDKLAIAIKNVIETPPAKEKLENISEYYKKLYSIKNQVLQIQNIIQEN